MPRDHHGNFGVERPLDQVAKSLAVVLPLAETIDDDETGAITIASCLRPQVALR
jgi:hypothetical protein